jgi:hypothetical protein
MKMGQKFEGVDCCHPLHRFPVPEKTLLTSEHIRKVAVTKSPGKANSPSRDTVDILITTETRGG